MRRRGRGQSIRLPQQPRTLHCTEDRESWKESANEQNDNEGGSHGKDNQGGDHWKDNQGGSHWTDNQGGSQWKDNQGGSHGKDNQGGSHVKDNQGGNHWKDNQGGSHWKDNQGCSQWKDNQGGSQWKDNQGGRQWGCNQAGRHWGNNHTTRNRFRQYQNHGSQKPNSVIDRDDQRGFEDRSRGNRWDWNNKGRMADGWNNRGRSRNTRGYRRGLNDWNSGYSGHNPLAAQYRKSVHDFEDHDEDDDENNFDSDINNVEPCLEGAVSEDILNGIRWELDTKRRRIQECPVLNLGSVEYNHNLPIFAYKDKIIEMVENNQVTIITSTVGSGKTSQIPQYILDHETKMGRFCNIVITQPRKIAAVSVTKYVSDCRGCEVGTLIGHQVALDKVSCEDTRILYCTTGILLHRLIGCRSLEEFTHVILDEAHDRVKDMDFLFLVIRKLLRTTYPGLKVIIMSATMEVEQARDYFSKRSADQSCNDVQTTPHVLSIDSPVYKVKVIYPEEEHDLTPLPYDVLDDPKFDTGCVSSVMNAIKYFDSGDEENTQQRKESKGTILVFLPGYQEIMAVGNEIKIALGIDNKFIVQMVHSEIALSDQWQIFQPPTKGYRKVILSTNISESSITVPDVKYVIDTCLTKELITDDRTGYTGLVLVWASRSSCEQRKGRCGRTSEGFCIRLLPRASYQQLCFSPTPEFLRTPLESVVLYTKMMDLGPPGAVLKNAMSPPHVDAVKQSMLKLFELGGLVTKLDSPNCFEDGDLSFIGRIMSALPLSVNLSKLIALGYAMGVLDECIIIAAMMSVRQVVYGHLGEEVQIRRTKLEMSCNSWSEPICYLNIFREWNNYVSIGALRSIADKHAFARRSHLNIRRLDEAKRLYEDIKKRLRRLGVMEPDERSQMDIDWQSANNGRDVNVADINEQLLKVAIAGACYPNYFRKGVPNPHEISRFLNGRNPSCTLKIMRISDSQGDISSNTQRSLENTYKFSNTSVEQENTNLFIQFNRSIPDSQVLPHFMTDRRAASRVHEDVIIASTIRNLVVPMRHVSNANDFSSSCTATPLSAQGISVLDFSEFTATITYSASHKWKVGQTIRCRICGILSPDDTIYREKGELTIKKAIVNQMLDIEVYNICGATHVVEIFHNKQPFSPSLVAAGLAAVDPNCISKAIASLGRMKSPLKTEMTGISCSTRGYSININTKDVNGHMLNLRPELVFERFIVALDVRRFLDSNLNLIGTTEMPASAGIGSLIILLFSPIAQIREDKYASSYTGVIGGLGSRYAIEFQSEHDLDIEFDAQIDRKDLEMVNELRKAMGAVLGSEGHCHGISIASATIQIIRSQFYKLITRSRRYRRPLPYTHTSYQWEPESTDMGRVFGIFHPHEIPALNPRPLLDPAFVKYMYNEEKMLREDMHSLRNGETMYCYLCDVLMRSKVEAGEHMRSDKHYDNADLIRKQMSSLQSAH